MQIKKIRLRHDFKFYFLDRGLLTLTNLSPNSADDFDNIFFLNLFPKTGFVISCKLSPKVET